MMEKIRLLIVGASGLVGSNCKRYFSSIEGYEVTGTYFSYPVSGAYYYDTLNPSNPENFDIEAFKPHIILHTGALTHVDYCEQHPEESYEKTVLSTRNLLDVAIKLGSRFCYISTDYVFDGQNGPYQEDNQVNPLSVYGNHKLAAEQLVRESLPDKHLILRITNVYGDEERNKNFVARLIQTISEDKSLDLKLPYDQYATPVNARDIARALEKLIAAGENGIFNIASTDYLNRVQLAQKVTGYFENHKVTIEAVNTPSMHQPAQRPLQGGLKAAKFLSLFPGFYFSSVDEYMQTRLFGRDPIK